MDMDIMSQEAAVGGRWESRAIQWMREYGWIAVMVVVSVLVVSSVAFAGGSGMPWESTLDDILQSLQGPVARFVGIVAIVITGLTFAIGEGGPWFKKAMGIALGLSIAFSASTFVDQLGFGGGAAF